MKQILFFALILAQTTIFSQNEAISGAYQLDFEASNGTYSETLILQSDGSFNFHSYKKLEGMTPPETHAYGKGTWELKKNIVYFTANETDLDSKFTLNLNNTEARFSTKSPRDASNQEVPTMLTIFKSDEAGLVGRKLEKQ
ncbi:MULTISPECIES: hypothetical protein [Bizionia]|uniref:Lipocalin-like domain-containing protein n=1 Tax=Bizionia algoritergicola TaxID=291187 RepID=A0A5D0R2F1_9FLAO|nr:MULTISPECIES: hypothetical protein [Bizionia]OBX23488.1 hypothetical protein BAA08_03800 [Bizionia sp. APA-3]TYB74981.1 hypothetical protein ES675_02270 [Bizionia algoritergicola]